MLERWIGFQAGWLIFTSGIFLAVSAFVNRYSYWSGEDASSIGIPIERPVMRVGVLTFLALLLACVVVACIGAYLVQANKSPWFKDHPQRGG